MKNVLIKGLILSLFTGAFFINCGDVEALTKVKTTFRNLGAKAKYSKDEEKKLNSELLNYKRQLIELKSKRKDVRLRLETKPTKKLEQEESKLTGQIATTESKISNLESKLENMAGNGVNTDQVKQNSKQIVDSANRHKKDTDNFVKDRKDGKLSAARYSNLSLLKLVFKQAQDLGAEDEAVKCILADTKDIRESVRYLMTRGDYQDAVRYVNAAEEDFGVPNERVQQKMRERRLSQDTNYHDYELSRPIKGNDSYLNSIRHNENLRYSNEYNRTLNSGKGRIDNRQDPSFIFNQRKAPSDDYKYEDDSSDGFVNR